MENGKLKVWLPAIRANSGADVYTTRLAAALERQGMAAQITWFPLPHELLPALLRHAKPPAGTDILIVNSWNGFAFRHTGLPRVAVVHHCSFDPELRRYKSALQSLYHHFLAEPREAKTLRTADAVVAVSRHVASHLQQKTGMNDVEVIHNWVDTGLFKPLPQKARGNRPFSLLFAGRLSRLKGGDLLAPLMRRLGTAFELRFTMDPQDCRNMPLPENMIPIGRLSEQEMVGAYQACDALLLPSRAEGFGYTVLEAMACGKPVVASNNTALPEIVVDDVTGILVDPGDMESLIRACRLLADNPALCSEMGSAGRQRAIESFSEHALIGRYTRLLMKASGRPARP